MTNNRYLKEKSYSCIQANNILSAKIMNVLEPNNTAASFRNIVKREISKEGFKINKIDGIDEISCIREILNGFLQ